MDHINSTKFESMEKLLNQKNIDLGKLKLRLVDSKKVIIICGPTGIGKTSLAIELAALFDSDIISTDSMQIYKGMDIGTDKIMTDSLGIKQYMVNIFNPDHRLTAKEFKDIALDIIYERFFKAKKIPLLAGGSGMYIKAIIDGIDEGPGFIKIFRDEIEAGIEKNGLNKYYKRLQEIDPEYAFKISKNDKRRIIRALEVYNASGTPFSRLQKSWNSKTKLNTIFIGLLKDRASLYSAIERRVDSMFANGLIDEVRELLKKGYGDSNSMKQAVGYKEVRYYLEGEISKEECIARVKQNSRRLAKKQMTWFRKDSRINWLSVDNYDNIIDLIMDTLELISGKLNNE